MITCFLAYGTCQRQWTAITESTSLTLSHNNIRIFAVKSLGVNSPSLPPPPFPLPQKKAILSIQVLTDNFLNFYRLFYVNNELKLG